MQPRQAEAEAAERSIHQVRGARTWLPNRGHPGAERPLSSRPHVVSPKPSMAPVDLSGQDWLSGLIIPDVFESSGGLRIPPKLL